MTDNKTIELPKDLTYEVAREKLIEIVTTLESTETELEKSLDLYKQGKAYADFCEKFLESAKEIIESK
ncbi:MAG: exodeoxyribonuclease VII small subunit [Bifidobacteriaceae bacterium]|jgi:exodeoxyribonuclease VII small subunit|nr:exodeoxyribonuclease VII small subunit [Bifidobacteriaceae bacterium]